MRYPEAKIVARDSGPLSHDVREHAAIYFDEAYELLWQLVVDDEREAGRCHDKPQEFCTVCRARRLVERELKKGPP